MKKQFLAISFYLLYLLAMIKPLIPMLEYYANYDYIVTVLCENKDKPLLKCNGKCYLQDQIKKNDYNNTHNHNSTVPLISLEDYPVSPIETFSYSLFSEENINSKLFASKHNTSQELLNSLFRPPQA